MLSEIINLSMFIEMTVTKKRGIFISNPSLFVPPPLLITKSPFVRRGGARVGGMGKKQITLEIISILNQIIPKFFSVLSISQKFPLPPPSPISNLLPLFLSLCIHLSLRLLPFPKKIHSGS